MNTGTGIHDPFPFFRIPLGGFFGDAFGILVGDHQTFVGDKTAKSCLVQFQRSQLGAYIFCRKIDAHSPDETSPDNDGNHGGNHQYVLALYGEQVGFGKVFLALGFGYCIIWPGITCFGIGDFQDNTSVSPHVIRGKTPIRIASRFGPAGKAPVRSFQGVGLP